MLNRWLTALALCLVAWAASAQGLLPVPALTGHVIDQTATLSSAQQQALESKLAGLEATLGSQVVVLLVATTQPEDIASYANRIANSWKIGRRDVGDGLLLIVAKNDRKLRIEVAKSLEGAIPDLAAKQVIETALTPSFKQGDYAGGIDLAVDQLAARIKGEALPLPVRNDDASFDGGLFEWQNLAVFVIFGVVLGGRIARSLFGNKLGAALTGMAAGVLVNVLTSSVLIGIFAALAAMIFTLVSNLTRTGRGSGFIGGSSDGGWSSGSSSDGGGFSSGGGGDFGGGGASGDW